MRKIFHIILLIILHICAFSVFANTQILEAHKELNMPARPSKSIQKGELKSYKFKSFGYFFDSKNTKLLELKQNGEFTLLNLKNDEKITGIFSVKDSKILLLDDEFVAHKNELLKTSGEIYKKLSDLKELKSYKSFNTTLIFAPFKGGADIFITDKNDKILEKTLNFENGIYKAKHSEQIFAFLDDTAFALGKNFTAFDSFWLITKGSFSRLSKHSHHKDIIKIYGSKNIRRNKELSKLASFDVFNTQAKMFSYVITNNKITQVKTQNENFKTDKNIGVGSTFSELKNAYKIDEIFANDNKIYVKINALNAVFELKNTQTNTKNLTHIPPLATITSITLNW